MAKYETSAGYVTKADTYAKLQHHLSEAEDCCYVISHLLRTEDSTKDELMATGWRGVGQLLHRVSDQILKLGMGKLQ